MITENKPEQDQPPKEEHLSSIVKDVGLILAGGAQKLPGPHRTCKEETMKQKYIYQKQQSRVFFSFNLYTFCRTALLQKP